MNLKYAAINENAFRFLRGTAHLFYEDLPKKRVFSQAPVTWLCGDLHVENFGSYKADNRLVYFDINDFDESTLGPCTLDLVRILTSIRVLAKSMNVSNEEVNQICKQFNRVYRSEIAKGHAGRIDTSIANGLIRGFLVKGKPKLILDKKHFYPIDLKVKKQLLAALAKWAKKQSRPAQFFHVKDAAIRIAGTGSLGIKRYSVLIEGKGYPENYLLDVKRAIPSSISKRFEHRLTPWKVESKRVVEIQRRMQDASPALLSVLKIGKEDYVIKEQQPSEDKLDFAKLGKSQIKFSEVVSDMAKIVAWAQIRSSGFNGSATIDDLIKFSKKKRYFEEIYKYSRIYTKQVMKDYEIYSKAYKNGEFSK